MENKKGEILSFIKQNGPVLPVQISKNTGLNMIFAGAILAELVSNKSLKITKAKVGGSPMYFAPGQEYKLGVLRDHLSQRPKQAYDILKDNKILRDKHCEPWQRVALREIEDFAVPLKVELKGIDEIFWKWYLLSNEDAKRIILSMLKGELPNEESTEKDTKEESPPKEDTKEESPPKEDTKEESPPEEDTKEEEDSAKGMPNEEESAISKDLEEEEMADDEPDDGIIENDEPEEEPPRVEEKREEKQVSLNAPKKLDDQGEFYDAILNFFSGNKISLKDQKVIRKNREMNFIVSIPSPVGELSYFVKAKNKKKVNEGELLLAFNEALNIKLPLLYICSGEMTNKADKYIQENIRGMVFKKL